MNVSPINLNKLPLFSLLRVIDHHFISPCIALAVVFVAVLSVASPVVAEEGFALIGAWEHTEKTVYLTITFNPNGTA